jgi:hypothetical protein
LRKNDERARRVALGAAGVVGATGLVVGPLGGVAAAVDEVTEDMPASRLRGRVTHADHGSTDEWANQRVSEGVKSFWELVYSCNWQGFRTFEHEQTGEWAYSWFSSQHSGCYLLPQWAEPPDRTTSELWDLIFKWKSSNTPGGEHAYIGKVDR